MRDVYCIHSYLCHLFCGMFMVNTVICLLLTVNCVNCSVGFSLLAHISV